MLTFGVSFLAFTALWVEILTLETVTPTRISMLANRSCCPAPELLSAYEFEVRCLCAKHTRAHRGKGKGKGIVWVRL